ncbi:hypothetical protein Tco_1253703 [Tanacetum coccineum]
MFINNDEENALSIRRVCLKLPMGKKVDENMMVTIESVKYKIWIKEIGVWRPSIIKLNDTDTSESNSKDDDGKKRNKRGIQMIVWNKLDNQLHLGHQDLRLYQSTPTYIKVGLKLGHDFNGCQQALNAIGRMGIQESIVTSTDLFTLKSLWGNFTFDFAVSSARGMSGDTSVLALDNHISDHRLILFKQESFDNGPKPFRFLNSWLDEPGFSDILSVAWEHTPHGHTLKAIHFKNKLKGLKGHLRSWCSGHLKSQILSKQDLLEKLKVIDLDVILGCNFIRY